MRSVRSRFASIFLWPCQSLRNNWKTANDQIRVSTCFFLPNKCDPSGFPTIRWVSQHWTPKYLRLFHELFELFTARCQHHSVCQETLTSRSKGTCCWVRFRCPYKSMWYFNPHGVNVKCFALNLQKLSWATNYFMTIYVHSNVFGTHGMCVKQTFLIGCWELQWCHIKPLHGEDVGPQLPKRTWRLEFYSLDIPCDPYVASHQSDLTAISRNSPKMLHVSPIMNQHRQNM